MDKKISYLARTFEDVKSELISFSKKYYPELSDSFNDASVGAWFIDLVSAVGDELAYHTDRMYQETNVNSANSKSTILNNARMNGIKIPGPKSSLCEVEISCELGISSQSIDEPDFSYAPKIMRGGLVGNSEYVFELTEDIDFNEQFNSDGYSNRKYTPIRNNNGVITGYKVTKSTIAVAGRSKVYKKVLDEDEVTPFMEIVLPEKNIMNVESIIFKESPNFKSDPKMYEFFIDEEEYKVAQEAVTTYRYFEVNSLADQYRFGTVTNFEGENENSIVINPSNPYVYQDFSEEYTLTEEGNTESIDGSTVVQTQRYYEGKWKPIVQKFITEYTDNGYMKVIFGSATDVTEVPIDGSTYADTIMSKVINNAMLGLLPKAGWTMYVLYRVGGGASANLAKGAINTVMHVDTVFPQCPNDAKEKSRVIGSFSVTNPTASMAGKDAPSTEEMKYLVKYAIPSQERCVALKDYKARIMQMPPKFGCPFRCNVIEDNNKISIPMLGLNMKGHLDSSLPEILVNNIKEYMFNYKNLTDYIELKSGRIYNIGFAIDVFIDKNYTTQDVLKTIIDTVQNYMAVSNHEMGEDIFIGDLERTINTIDGVISLIDMKIYNIYGGSYSKTKCPLPNKVLESSCNTVIAEDFTVENASGSFLIDLEQVDGVLYADYDAMYEIKNPEIDIKIRAKLR